MIYSALEKQKGLTLPEIMISLAIGSTVLAATFQIFTSNKQQFRFVESLSRIQEEARYAMETLAFELRMTGYQVCGETGGRANMVTGASGTWSLDVFGSTIQGYENGAGVSSLPTSGEGVLVAGTDAVSFKSIRLDDAYYVQSHNTGNAQITLNKTSDFVAGDLAAVCDSQQTSVFQVSTETAASNVLVHTSTGNESPGNCTDQLGASCGSTATPYQFSTASQVFHVDSFMYYIGMGSDGETPGLYKAELVPDGNAVASVVPELIASNVNNLDLEYGEDTNADGVVDTYIAANAVTDWDRVLSVQIFLVFRSHEDNLVAAGDEQTYSVNGTDITALDRRIHRVFSSTVGIRNRLL